MARVDPINTNFTSGELSQKLIGRVDIAKYANGVDTLENFLIMLQGGITRRPGTRYLAETRNSAVCRLLPFQYSADQDYVVAATDQKFRMYSNSGSLIEDTSLNTYIKFLSNFNGNDGCKEIVDSGNTGHIITQVGTAQTSSAQKKFGTTSLLLDGNSDYLTIPDHADWNFGTGKFTIECNVYFNTVSNFATIFNQFVSGTDFNRILYNASVLSCQFYSGGVGLAFNFPFVPSTGIWYHIMLVRDGDTAGTWHAYIDGVEQTKTLTDGAYNVTVPNLAQPLWIGYDSANSGYVNGYIDEYRISNVARQTAASFTVPTAAYTSDANTLLLLHMDSLDITGNNALSFYGDAQLDTAQKKYGTASLRLDGTGDYVTLADSADWDITTGDFTIAGFFMIDDLPGNGVKQTIASQYASATSYWELGILNTLGTYSLYFKFYNGAAQTVTVDFTTLLADTFYHLAMTKSGNNYYFFQDGVQLGTTQVNALSVLAVAGVLQIGAYNGTNNPYDGWIDDMEIDKGYARYTAAFAVPVSEAIVSTITITELSTPYLVASLFELQHAHKGDIKYIVHADYAPRKLSRTSATAFAIDLADIKRGPFLDTNTTATTITPSADTGAGITITASSDLFDDVDDLHVGALWRIKSGVVKITSIASATVATADVQTEPSGADGNLATGPGATTDWAEGAFSAYRGYPAVCAFHDGSLYYACTEYEPQKIWKSCLYDYDNFAVGAAADDDAATFEIATEERVAIRWLSSGNKALSIGSTGGTFSAYGTNNGPITPTDVQVNRDTNYGSALLPAKKISSFLYYIQRNLHKVRELSYFYDYDVTRASDMTMLAEHILRDGDGVVDWDYQQSPNDRLWCVRDDGEIAVITRNPEQDVMGWSRIIAGADAVGNGIFESVCVIPKAEDDDQVWVVVKRVINGTTKRFIEFFMAEDFDETWDAVFVDSSLSLDSPKTITAATAANPVVITSASHGFSNGDQVKINGVVGMTELNDGVYLVADKTDDTFELTSLTSVDIDGSAYGSYVSGGEVRKMVNNVTGLGHLEGETVQVQVDGDVPTTNSFVVTAGTLVPALTDKAAIIHVGLPNTPLMKTLRPEGGSQLGTSQGKIKRIPNITARFYRTRACQLGIATKQDRFTFDELYTGDKNIPVPMGWDGDSQLVVTSDKPLPLTLIALMPRISVSDL